MRGNLSRSAILLSISVSCFGYTQDVSRGVALQRNSPWGVPFQISPTAAAGLTNASGKVIIAPGTDPVDVIRRSMAAWNAVSGTQLAFAELRVVEGIAALDGQNFISFADTAEARSLVGSAIAVTIAYNRGNSSAILDTDIVVNPDYLYSSTGAPGSFDLQSVMSHELGHTLGIGHTWLPAATMYPYMGFETQYRSLSADDRAAMRAIHPPWTAPPSFGNIDGAVHLSSGNPARTAFVVAVNAADGGAVGVISSPIDGSYKLWPLDPGDYTVYVEPYSSILDMAEAGSAPGLIDTDFQTTICGGADAPQVIHVDSVVAVAANITLDAAADFNINSFSVSLTGPGRLDYDQWPSGLPLLITIFGNGIESSVSPLFLGPGFSVRSDSVNIQPASGSGQPGSVSFTADVAAESDWTTITPVLRKGPLAAVYDGIRVMPSGPVFKPSNVVNSASFIHAPIAPGEIITIFGSGLAPLVGITSTGAPQTELGGVEVLFDGTAAPLLYAGSGQINAQAPFELAGRDRTVIEVRYAGASTGGVPVDVGISDPGTYAVVNEDGTVNTRETPVARGRIVTLYGTGQGATDPPLATGALAPSSPLSMIPAASVSIGNMPAPVLFAGMAPGFAGLFQINLRVPDDLPPGPQNLAVTLEGVSSPQYLFLYVQ